MNLYNTARSIAAASAGLLAATAFATTTTVTVLPSGASGISANTTTSAPGFGSASFQESGNAKGELYVASTSLFGRQIAFSEIASVSYWTNKPGAADSVDWSFYIYTALTGSGDTGTFYHTRLVSEPLYSNSPAVAANTWHQWSTANSIAPMTFYDVARDGGIQGTNNDPTLAQLQGATYTWAASGTQVSYRNELVNLFSLQTGSAWSAGFLGLVDGLTITLTNGDIGRVNLEAVAPSAVPEPESIALMAIGTLGLFAAARRKRRA